MSTVLTGKVVLVTGAGSGIGKVIAVGLAEHGAEVVLIGRREQALNETADLIRSKGGKASSHIADVCQKKDVDIMVQKVLAHTGVPSILVNAAGIYGEINPITIGDPELWIQTLMTNTAGPYLICRAFVNEMVQKGWGRIVNITSAASLAPPRPTNSAYAVSKVALNHFTRQLAVELEGSGVTANVMHPGEVKTEMFEAIKKKASPTGDMSKWVNWVEQTGGDAPEKSVKLILDLIKPESDPINGRFLWIENGLKKAAPSWD
jgi:NAD(P)-dependent dehydrogenase (short-subunit alcohol dehydrogenase family)